MEKFLELKLPSINNRLKKRMRWKKIKSRLFIRVNLEHPRLKTLRIGLLSSTANDIENHSKEFKK